MIQPELKKFLIIAGILLIILGGCIGYYMGFSDSNNKCEEACNKALINEKMGESANERQYNININYTQPQGLY